VIGRLLALAFLSAAALVVVVVATQEPDDRLALGSLLFGLGAIAFALSAAFFYYVPARRRRRARVALRRGAIVGVAVAVAASLRAVDALTIVPAIFVLAALAAFEGMLSARG